MTGTLRSRRIAPVALFFVALSLVAALGCATRRPPRAPIPRATPTDELAPGDTVQVWVEGEPALSATYRVAPDGTIEPAGCPRVIAMQKTPEALTAELRACFVAVRKDPVVRVTVLSRQRFVLVLGQVQKPGRVPFEHAKTIVQAITWSGGFTATAWTDHVRLTRKLDGQAKVFAVDVKGILAGEDADLELDPGDQLFVPERVF